MVRLTDRPDMTLDVYRGHKTTTQQHYARNGILLVFSFICYIFFICLFLLLHWNTFMFIILFDFLEHTLQFKTMCIVFDVRLSVLTDNDEPNLFNP